MPKFPSLKTFFLLSTILFSVISTGCQKDQNTVNITIDDLQNMKIVTRYDDFPEDMEAGSKAEDGLYTSQKYGFRVQLPKHFDLWYKGITPLGGIKKNQEVGGECFNLIRDDFGLPQRFIVGRVCISVNPFALSPEEWSQVNLKPGMPFQVLGKNNKFIFDFEYHTETRARENFSAIEKETEDSVLSKLELFDINYPSPAQ